MCIVLLTTAHPSYALIAIDNRDEFILRPTSRPHWWTHQSGVNVLSSRDLQRAEKGTWLGITDHGVLAVLTNYRETDIHDAAHPVHAQRSRGGMVTSWLGRDPGEPAEESVHQLVKEGGVKGVGGFSMVAGKLRKRRKGGQACDGEAAGPNGAGGDASGGTCSLEPIAIISNRCDNLHDVPWIGDQKDEVYGLSNTSYDNPVPWPKVTEGKRLLKRTIDEAVAQNLSEEALVERLFDVLDTDTLPPQQPGASFAEHISELKKSIFIPPIGDETHRMAMERMCAKGKAKNQATEIDHSAAEELERPDAASESDGIGFETGMYGTQRQTIILVDWEGNVSYRERALWDGHGNKIERGNGDVVYRFKIEGWDA